MKKVYLVFNNLGMEEEGLWSGYHLGMYLEGIYSNKEDAWSKANELTEELLENYDEDEAEYLRRTAYIVVEHEVQ